MRQNRKFEGLFVDDDGNVDEAVENLYENLHDGYEDLLVSLGLHQDNFSETERKLENVFLLETDATENLLADVSTDENEQEQYLIETKIAELKELLEKREKRFLENIEENVAWERAYL